MSQGIIQQFGKQAEEYYKSLYHAQGKDLRFVVQLAEPRREHVVLDLATGAGHTAFAVAEHAGRVLASDITPKMLDQARSAAESRNIDNVELMLIDAHSIPLFDDSLDLVTCRAAPHHFRDIDLAVKEAFRVVKPGGCLVIVDGSAPEDPALHEFLDYLETIRDPSHNRRYSLSQWQVSLQSSGFTVEHAHTEKDIYVFDDWMKVAGVDDDLRKKVEEVIVNATPEQYDHFNFKIENNRVLSMRNDRAVIKGRKPDR